MQILRNYSKHHVNRQHPSGWRENYAGWVLFLVKFNKIVLQPFFVERVFQIFDKDDSGSISFQEFIDAIHQFAGQTPEDKIKFLFKVYDIDGG